MKTMIRTTLFTVTLGLAFATSAHARIGETREQIEVRLGPPAKADASQLVWMIKDLGYVVTLDAAGKSVVELIMPTVKFGGKITETQLEVFLKSHLAPNVEWVEIHDILGPVSFAGLSVSVNPVMERAFKTSDGKLFARFKHRVSPCVMVYSESGAQLAFAEKLKEEEKAAVKF
jgi:hypothetical protein